jgi:hypothetical protein
MNQKRTGKRLALIIASYEYPDDSLRKLIAPAQDAEALARVLQDPDIGGFQVQTLLNEPSHQVNRAIEAFFVNRKRDDPLLLYFSGHGIKDDWGRLYFSTTDTCRSTPRTTAIPASLVNDVMTDSRSRQQVLLLDCRYSGAFARTKADQTVGVQEQVGGRGRVVLTSSDAVQYSFEGDEIEGEGVRSVFTRVLVQGLETGTADRDREGHCNSINARIGTTTPVGKYSPQGDSPYGCVDIEHKSAQGDSALGTSMPGLSVDKMPTPGIMLPTTLRRA